MLLDCLEECLVDVAESLQGFTGLPIEVWHHFIVRHIDSALLGFVMSKGDNLSAVQEHGIDNLSVHLAGKCKAFGIIVVNCLLFFYKLSNYYSFLEL